MPDENETQRQLTRLRSLLTEKGGSWRAGETSMSALSDAMFKRRLGARPTDGRTLADIERQAAARSAALLAERRAPGTPAAYDLRNVGGKNFITQIKDQGACGSCVAFGVCAAMEGTLRVQENDPNLSIDLSEAHLFYCHGRAQGRNCDNGWIPDEALQACQNAGIVDDACYPYTAGDQDCTGRCSDWQQRLHKVTAFHTVSATADMKTWLSTKGPLPACFVVYADFRHYRSGVYRHVSGEQLGGHCVSIVGYNDSDQCWICKNSWGTGWGEDGFFKIGYGECAIDTWQVCAVEGVTKPEEHHEEEGVWQRNRLVTALWCNGQPRNAWIYADGLGWRRITPDSDVTFLNLLYQSAGAKAARRRVNFFEERDTVKEIYVL
jgi:Papain family cysteine protease